MLSVGALAVASGVPATTLRYYDGIGLLVPDRLANGHRRYPPAAVERLRLIRLCQALGLPLDEIAALLAAGGTPQRRRDIARRRLRDVERQLQELAAVRAVLEHFAECRHTAGQSAACGAAVVEAMQRVLPAASA